MRTLSRNCAARPNGSGAIQTGPSFGGSSGQPTGSPSSIKRADRNAQSMPSGWSTERDVSRMSTSSTLLPVRSQSERRRIAVDTCLRSTSNPAVYVCGDAVAETAQLSPIATYEGRIVGRNVVDGAKHTPDYASIPACVFTVPVLASVGLTQADAEVKGLEFRVAVNDMRAWLSIRTDAEREAWAKVVIDKRTDRVIGAHLVGHAREDLIHIFALAINMASPQVTSGTSSTGSRRSPPTSNRCYSSALSHLLSCSRGKGYRGNQVTLGNRISKTLTEAARFWEINLLPSILHSSQPSRPRLSRVGEADEIAPCRRRSV